MAGTGAALNMPNEPQTLGTTPLSAAAAAFEPSAHWYGESSVVTGWSGPGQQMISANSHVAGDGNIYMFNFLQDSDDEGDGDGLVRVTHSRRSHAQTDAGCNAGTTGDGAKAETISNAWGDAHKPSNVRPGESSGAVPGTLRQAQGDAWPSLSLKKQGGPHAKPESAGTSKSRPANNAWSRRLPDVLGDAVSAQLNHNNSAIDKAVPGWRRECSTATAKSMGADQKANTVEELYCLPRWRPWLRGGWSGTVQEVGRPAHMQPVAWKPPTKATQMAWPSAQTSKLLDDVKVCSKKEEFIDDAPSASSEEGRNREPEPEVSAEEDSIPQITVTQITSFSIQDVLKWRSSVRGSVDPGMRIIAAAVASSDSNTEVGLQKTSFAQTARESSTSQMSRLERPKHGVGKGSEQELDGRREKEKKHWDSWEEQQQHPDVLSPNRRRDRLETSENSWIGQIRARRTTGGELDGADVARATKSILNKLTLEKFSQLYQQLVSCGISTVDHLEMLICEVFEKATTQHHFINMYADLCALLDGFFTENPVSTNPKCTFKKLLLNACQLSFEKNLTPPTLLRSLEPDERILEEVKYKMRMIGNIRFIGALLVRKMLAAKVLFAILEELLSDPTAEALESLAALLTVTGPAFDKPDRTHYIAMNAIFVQVSTLVQKPSVEPRARCLLKDVLDLRARGWHDNRPQKMEGPSTLEEVYERAAAEEGSPMPPRSPASFVGMTRTHASVSGWSTPGSGVSVRNQRRESPTVKARTQSAAEAEFDKNAYRAEIRRALAELRVTHDAVEALQRIANMKVPVSHQPKGLRDLLLLVVEEGTASARLSGFRVANRLFLDGYWTAKAASEGIQTFVEICPDLKVDIPALPQILREEFGTSLEPLIKESLLDEQQFQRWLEQV